LQQACAAQRAAAAANREAQQVLQNNRVYAENKFGRFEVPNEFLNTFAVRGAAVAPETVRQARLARASPSL